MTRKTPSGTDAGSGNKALALLIGTTCGFVVAPNVSMAGPAGGVVTGGQGTISTPTTTSTVIDQSSNRLSVDWQSFDVASSESVSFHQPSSNSVALNRILDQKPSEVFGRIDANGRVVLFNSNGIMFGPGSQVNVGSLLATSLNVVSFDESTGRLRLSATGTPGSIINNGSISAAPGGSVSLVGGMVANNGLIVADFGSVNLAAGRSATLDFYGGGLLRFDADSSLTENASGSSAGVSNTGQISADGGQVLLTTSAVRNVFDRAVNNDGLVSANRIDNSGGSIRLVGSGGTVINSGVLDASGVGSGSTGGSVQVLGENVGLFGNARVDVSGDAGGGTALLGGDYQGANPDVPNASQTIIGPDAEVVADARVAGDGGRVIVWSDDLTRYFGGISARGGADSGNGGFAEVSSHGALAFNGRVNLGAPAGVGGELLLDPEDITIADTGPDTDVDLNFNDDPDNNPATNPPSTIIDADAIVAALTTGASAVNLRATDDITVDEAIDVSLVPAANTRGIILRAGDNITINQLIATRNGSISITAADPGTTPVSQDGDGTGDVTFGAAGSLNSGTATITISSQGDLALRALTGGAISVTSTDGAVTQLGGAITGTTLAVSAGTSINIDTTVGTLTNANAATSLNIDNTGNLVVNNAAGVGVTISATGNLTLGMVDAGGATATLTSINGAILDDNLATAISGANINLDAETNIGTVTDLRAGTGSSVDVNTAGALTATVASPGGQINLNLIQVPTVAAGGIDLGGASAATGTVLLQTDTGVNFNLSNPATTLAVGAINLGAGNTAQVGLRSGGTLTLPNATNSIFDNAPGTLAVTGATDIVDDNGPGLSFTVGNLIFDSGAAGGATSLTTNINQLTAAIGGNQNLAVIENDDLVLNTVNVGTGTVTLDVNGAISDGVGATPSVVANQLSITDADSVDLDTNVGTLNASGVTNALTVREQTGPLNVVNASTTNGVGLGGPVNVSTVNGAMTVAIAGGVGVTLNAGGATSDLAVTGIVNAGAGLAALTAGRALTLGTVNADSATLTSNGAMTLGTVNANTATGTVTLAAGTGAITDAVGTTPSVVANQLTITSASSANLDTNVNALTATGVGTGGVSVREQSGALAVTNVNTTGAVDISTVAGGVTVANTAGNGVTLNAGGAGNDLTVTGTVNSGTGAASLTAANAITLGIVNAGAGTVTLAAGGAITDAAPSSVPSVVAGLLTVTGAGSVDLDTNVTTLSASGVTAALTIRDQVGALAVTNASAIGAVNVSTVAGALNVTNAAGNGVTLNAGGATSDLSVTGTVNAGAGLAALTAGRAMTLGTVNADSATLTSNGAMTLGTVNANPATGTVTLAAGTGAITDAVGTTPSVVANQLTITSASSASLDTNVNSLTASGVGTGGVSVREQTGALAVTNVTTTGAVNVSTVAGALNVTNATGNGVTLNAGGAGNDLTVTGTVNSGTGAASLTSADAITLGIVNAGAGTVTLAAGGAISDAPISVPSVVAGLLTVTGAGSVDLDTNVTTLNASGVTGALTIRDQVGTLAVTNASATGAVDVRTIAGALNVTNAAGNGVRLEAGGAGSDLSVAAVNAGAGAATLIATGGSIVDDDTGTTNTTTVSGGSVALTAGNSIGTVTDFANATGLSVDVNTTGTLSASAGSSSGAINLNVSGAPIIASGGIALGSGTGRSGTVLLQSANALNLQNLAADAINIGTPNTASVGFVSGGLLTLPVSGSPTDAAPSNLLVSGADIVQGPTASRTIGLTANLLVFNASAPAGDFLLNTNVGTLNANVTNGVALNVDESTGDIALGNIVAQTIDVHAGGAIFDDGDLAGLTTLTAGTVQLTSTGAIGDSASALDVNTADLTAVAGGNVAINSTGAGPTRVALTAGSAAAVAGNGNIFLTGAGEVRVAQLLAAQDIVNVSSAGQIINDAAVPVVTANQLVISGASAVNLGTDVNSLDAIGVTGALTISESSGPLTVTNANSTGGAVNVSTVAGAMTVASAAGNGVTLNAGTGGALTVTGTVNAGAGAATLGAASTMTLTGSTVTAGSAALTSNGAMTLGTVNANPTTGTVTLAAGTGAITDAVDTTPSVVANQLSITSASSANLDTNVNSLTASGVTGGLTISEANALAVTNANATGAVNLSTVAGAMTVANATGNGVTLAANGATSDLTVTGTVAAGTGTATLTAGRAMTLTGSAVNAGSAALTSNGAMALGAVNANATTGLVTLAAGTGAITDGAGVSVVANQLTIMSAGSADLNTNVNSLTASGVTGGLTVSEANALAVTNANATGAVNLSTVAGAMTVANATGNGITLNAGGATSDLTVAGTVAAGAGTATLNAGRAMTLGTVTAGGAVNASSAGAMTVANATGNGVTLNAGGAASDLTVTGTVGAGTGAATLTAGRAMTLTGSTVNAGSAALTSNGAMALGAVNANATTGTVTLAAGTGAITDGAGVSVVANQLTITSAGSADLNTNVNSLTASGITGALAISEASGPLTVTNAAATGAVNLSTVAGAMTVTNAVSTNGALTLAAGGTGDLNVTAASGTSANLTSGGAMTIAGNTLNAGTGAATLTSGGAMTLGTVNAGSATLTSGGTISLGTVNVGTGTATLTAAGAISDGTTGTAITAGTANITANSIGSASNTLDTSVANLSAEARTGGMFFQQSNSSPIALTNLLGATGQDIVVVTPGDITVGQIDFNGTSSNGRVLLAAGSDILATGTGTNITAQNVELRAGGVDSTGGRIGSTGNALRMDVPLSITGGGGSTVPSVLLLQNQSSTDPNVAAQTNLISTVSSVEISAATFDPVQETNPQRFLTTTFSTRTADGEGVRVQNADFFTGSAAAGGTGAQNVLAAQNATAAALANTASNAQGEGTLYIDWASFDPNVSLFGTVNPPICLPGDQSEEVEESDAAAPASPSTSTGCASSTAQRDGSTIPPQAKLVISSRGWEWVNASGKRRPSDPPLIGQLR